MMVHQVEFGDADDDADGLDSLMVALLYRHPTSILSDGSRIRLELNLMMVASG